MQNKKLFSLLNLILIVTTQLQFYVLLYASIYTITILDDQGI